MDPEPSSEFLAAIENFDWTIGFNTALLLVLLVLSALISGAEVAFFSLSQTDLDKAEDSKSTTLKSVVKLLKDPKQLLATILITNNFINILIVLLFASLGEFYFAGLDYSINFYIGDLDLRFLLEVVLITFLILLFGEVLPKVYATRNSLKFATFMINPLTILNKVLVFLSKPMTGLTGFIERKLGKKQNELSVEKLSQALELTSEGATTKGEQKILEGIVSFGNTETTEVMKPRIDIFALSDEEPYEVVLKKIVKKGYSRNPVYHENIDEIIGVLYAKDLLPHLHKKNFKWQKILREPFFVPENKKLDDLLNDFQEKKKHLAVVVDEYGGTSGIVTLEDVIEEIVGDISDEYDDDDLSYSKLDAYNYIFDGKITLKDFYKVLDIDDEVFEIDRGEAETLAGFILEISGKFPKQKEKIKYHQYSFVIEALDRNRIKQVKVTLSENEIK